MAVGAGHVQASTLLGVLLVSGPQGVDKDIEAGKRLIEAAAAKGDAMAQRAAGIGYLDGEFGLLNPGRAAGYFKSAVAAGDLPAMMHYAHMLFTGAGAEKDEAAAEDLVERAARAGLTIAQETLGNWILERYKAGVTGDPSEGVRWLERAYQQGFSITALTRLAVFFGDEGRGPKWSDRAKSLELFTQGAAFADLRISVRLRHGGPVWLRAAEGFGEGLCALRAGRTARVDQRRGTVEDSGRYVVAVGEVRRPRIRALASPRAQADSRRGRASASRSAAASLAVADPSARQRNGGARALTSS